MSPFLRKLAIALLRFQINTTALFSPIRAGRMALDIFRTPRKGRLRDQDRLFLQGMIKHHQGAIEMAMDVKNSNSMVVAELSAAIITQQEIEITRMEELLLK
jgi:uncharacterized protein (DUF305 family)